MRDIKLGKYRHFKGYDKIYQVIGTAVHSETLEELVIYKMLYDMPDYKAGTIWVRPKEMFLEKAPVGEKNITGQEYRFEYID